MNREKELLFDELYEKTKDYGRVQFINLLMEKERENNELREYFEAAKEVAKEHKKNEIKLKDRLEEQRKEYQEIKKQLSNSHQIKDQQKEFIEWLEQNIENEEYCYLAQNPGERCRKDVFEEALSKYKEIIGGKHE